MDVDLLVLSRDLSPLRPDVERGIRDQRGVRLRLHRVVGARRASDRNRFETIARARNAARRMGEAPWAMFVDDDVVLGPDCVASLVAGLSARPGFAAMGADCAGEMESGWDHWDYPRHVGMACTMFRRDRLEAITFRWEGKKCECRCCCDDLRRDGHGIGYLPGALAWHRPSPSRDAAPAGESTSARPGDRPPGRVLAAFDRRHQRLFVRRFLASLRGSGNRETVTAVVYGLYPSERRALAAMPGVEVFVARPDGHPAQRRLRDFQEVIAGWPEETPVAYWDAADVVFQGGLGPLWDLVRAHPDRLLAVAEPVKFSTRTVAGWWAVTIRDPGARRRAIELFTGRPLLNAGFAAGTVRPMLRYLDGALQLLHSPALHGSADWGDQTAMNLFCHSNPGTWLEIPSTWNFCLVGRRANEVRIDADGRTQRRDGQPVSVVHGAGQTLKFWDLAHLTA